MASTSRTVPSSPNPSTQGSPHNRDWNNPRMGEPGSGFRGISRGRGSRGGGVRGGRGGGLLTSSGQRGSNQLDTASSTQSPSLKVTAVSRKPPVPTTTPNGVSEKAINGTTERGGRPRPSSRKQPQAVPTVVVAPASPSEPPQTPSRSNRRRRPQCTTATATTKPPFSDATKTQKPRSGSTPASQAIMRKDVPPHLAAAHEAEIRHDIDALVERVRAVAMAENRPTTPGSHIDWAGDEDDSLPDLDDWGVTTTHKNVDKSEISPILVDTLRPLPEPNSEVLQEEEQGMETYDAQSERVEESPIQPSFLPSPTQDVVVSAGTKGPSEQCIIAFTNMEESSSPTLLDERLSLHPSLPPKPITAIESSGARDNLSSNASDLPPKLPVSAVEEEALTTKTEGLSESIHAPSADDHLRPESVSSASSSERALTTSIHAPVPGLPESRSAPSLLSSHITSTVPHTHFRSQTEGHPAIHHPNTVPPGMVSHRRGRSGASSPLGKHVYTHARNHSTPAGGSRPPHASRPVITGEAISRLARTIGGLGPTSRTQTIPVTRDSTISS